MANRIINKTAHLIIVGGMLVIALFPLIWAIFGSFKTNAELFANPYNILPDSLTLNNYTTLFGISDFPNSIKNSFIASFASTFLSIVIACLASYSLTRFSFRGAKLLKRFSMGTYMIAPILLVLPIYSLLTKLGLRDNFFTYIIITMSQTLPFCLWLFNSYFAGVPVDFEEAAMIDGCTRFKAFYKAVLPQLVPAIIAVGIQAFILVWNDLLFAKILLSSDSNRTIPMVISTMFAKDQVYPWGVILAGTVVVTIPVLSMFVFGVEKLISGWSEGGVKG